MVQPGEYLESIPNRSDIYKSTRDKIYPRKNEMKIKESIDGEFIGIINYCMWL